MNHSLTMLPGRLQTTAPASQVTFTRDELNILIRALSAYTATPADGTARRAIYPAVPS